MVNNYMTRVYDKLSKTFEHETEFLQAVKNFLDAIEPVIEKHPEYEDLAILERITEPERIISFRVPWVDDQGKVQVNRGYRVQFNSLNGPYKGGIRFHPSVNQSIMKFLAFEQIFKNDLTGLPIGGGKGGADFDPKGKSDNEVMNFTQSFMTELQKYIGADEDVPAGDIGVGAREIGYMFGQYKRLNAKTPGVLTGKPIPAGGSQGRTEATGYGLIYFLLEMLIEVNESLEGKRVMISGSGNVAYFAAKKAMELGGVVVSLSDSDGAIYAQNGIDLDTVKQIKIDNRGRIKEYIDADSDAEYFEGSLWDHDIKADIALPCATQNEINEEQAQRLVDNGIKFVAEGANMPSHTNAVKVFKENKLYYGPGKAANAGGVAVSALEMSQNSQRLRWTTEEVDEKLKVIMKDIFKQALDASNAYDLDHDYAAGADIASFESIAKLMIMNGVV
ncbi:NADP-specific glutamate dehydrogenase [Aerococcaceae bacterium INB8]|uniref:Glutamate dehydrogenase n=2 Tax=Ruoffia halotolerans TaxID=2748684 RepID=A0A839A492_9LACT|nr:NADP-specific glutamate dehydrogenase [Ruoffia halotolerans]MBA5728827.1 NADP-specific glutamate dehydrogenase [Ruoffia halotolerans]